MQEPKAVAGIVCRRCGSRLLPAVNSLPISPGKRRRYRKCRGCGLRVRVTEFTDAALAAEILAKSIPKGKKRDRKGA